MKKIIFVALITAFLVSGCSWFNRLVNEHEFTMQLAVEEAAARVLHAHPGWKSETVNISRMAIIVIDAKDVSDLGSVEEFIKSKIKWQSMLPEEQALVSVLITEVRKNIEDSLRAKGIINPGKQLIEVRKVMEWINAAASRAV